VVEVVPIAAAGRGRTAPRIDDATVAVQVTVMVDGLTTTGEPAELPPTADCYLARVLAPVVLVRHDELEAALGVLVSGRIRDAEAVGGARDHPARVVARGIVPLVGEVRVRVRARRV